LENSLLSNEYLVIPNLFRNLVDLESRRSLNQVQDDKKFIKQLGTGR
jgi:hypothetical protein